MNFWLIVTLATLASQFCAKEAEAKAGEKPGFIRLSIRVDNIHVVCEEPYPHYFTTTCY